MEDTAVLISSDHGEAFGELGVYADHQAADEVTCHIPSILKWPGLEPQTFNGLQYHLDVAATVVDLAGLRIPSHWDGESVAKHVREGNDAVREFLVLSQGAWSCQRSVRWDDYLYMRTWHDGFHGHWNEEMLFDITNDPHEQDDLFSVTNPHVSHGRSVLSDWTSSQLERGYSPVDPMEIVLEEGGPFHTSCLLYTSDAADE